MKDNSTENPNEMEQALGRAISYWASVEGSLCQIFCIATTARKRETAAAIFTAIISFEVQLAVTRAAMNVSFADKPKPLELWNELAKRFDKLRPLRNKLAHGNILILRKGKAVLSVDFLPFHHFGAGKVSDHYEHWSISDLNKLSDAFLDLARDLSCLNVFLLGHGPLPEISPLPNLKLGRKPAFQRVGSSRPHRP